MTSMMQNPQGDGDCGGGGGGGRIFVMQAMRSPSERYLSSESLENDRNSTTSSTESPNGTVTHRKDHEFIPTRVKTINASRPAADPSKFTKVPSNPLLVSAHQQLKQAEEIKKKKKESTQLKVKRGDEEPDWQSNLSSWKSRRRKQSEDALQRMAEVKALEDGQKTGQPRKISIGKKLSSLLYTSGEDLDWSEMGLDKDDEQSDDERLREDTNEGKSPQRRDSDLLSRSASREEDASSDKDSKQQPEWTSSKVQNWMEVIRQDAPRKSASQPLVTYSQRNVESVPNGSSQQQQQPQVRRKSSELSSTMKTRLEAFNDVGGGGGGVVENAPKPTVAGPIEPDQQFHQKLMAFRRISEGNLEQRQEELMKPKPPQSIGSLLGGQQNVSQSNARTLGSPPLTPEDSPRNNGRNNEDYENDTLEDVDQLLDDALEESYRSVLEDRPASKVFVDTDFVRKDAPLEKPPPPPPPTTTTTAKGNSNNNKDDDDDDVDQQEREIIASLGVEEREHNRYISEKMKRLPTPSSSSSSSVAIYDDSGISSSGKHPPSRQDVLSSERSRRNNLRNETDFKKNNYNSAQKRQPNEQRAYDQHWLIQEAEQRRRQDSAKQKSTNGGSSIVARDGQRQNMAAATTTENSPVYENSLYVNQQPRQLQHTTIIPSASSNNSVGLVSAPAHNENVYANLSSQSSDQLVGSRDGRKPGPRVPPRSQHDPIQSGSKGERVLSVSGRKRCSHCKEELGRGAAMIIESLRLYYHLKCFQCCVCQIQLGNGVSGTDVRVRNNKLHCQNCYSNDEGLKFSKV